MKQKSGKKPSRPESFKRKPKFSLDEDAFFESDPKRRRKIVGGGGGDDVIESDDSDEEGGDVSEADGGEGGEEKEQVDTETADEKRYRVAKEYLEKFRYLTKREEEEKEEEEGEEDEEEREGRRDSLVAAILQKEQLEESGRAQRFLASRVQKPEALDEFQVLVRHRLSVTAVALAEDDMRGFSASKDGTIIHWDVETGKKEKYLWPNEDVLVSHGAKSPQNKSTKRSKHVLALAVSSDGRYLATGGLDRHIHLWDTRTREHIQAFHGHKGPVSCLTFRQGTSQLFSASSDRTIKLWNAEDRCHLDNLFGHQSEVLTIDCLRKERVLTAARDRTMRLWKVPEESQLVYRAPASSLECACFVNNEEFLSGSDDGSIELWSILRKKPVCIVKNAHTMPIVQDQPNGECANEAKSTSSARSWVSSVTACRGSDLAASGAANDVVRLWAIESDTKSIRPLYDLPLVGYINSLAFARSGRFLVAGVGQEPRLGRWGCVPAAQNGVALYSLRHS